MDERVSPYCGDSSRATERREAMETNVFRHLAIETTATLATVIWATAATAVTPIASCPQALDKPGETYIATDDLVASGTCLTVAADRITIDFRAHVISGGAAGTVPGQVAVPSLNGPPPADGHG